ncbi:MFS transporter [Trueperella pyogenes]|uniref:MFS transporter n=1 Tax=Trueperella pyogenes TaxID=1661 RepID=UPI000D259576|nr:MFS transporter [Trueperella pyogenes]AWA43518.1 MFS transporter [Trueperella pyogenes]
MLSTTGGKTSRESLQNARRGIAEPAKPGFVGNDKLLLGIVLSVVTYWLFAGTLGNLVTVVVDSIGTQHITESVVSLAAPLAGLFSGLFIVVAGGLADRIGRVKVTLIGIVFSIVGSALLVLAVGGLATPFMLVGRALQGVSTACIMPATMALLKAYWDGPARQRAVSMWSIGSWGGSGFAALFGGFLSQQLNWRWIFVASIAVAVLAFLLIVRTPESKADVVEQKKFDVVGLVVFMIALLALMVALIFGAQMPGGGWASPVTIGLYAVAIAGLIAFVVWEKKQENPFIDFSLFKNTTFTGATISNFMINATIGLLNVSQLVFLGSRPRTIEDCGSELCVQNFVDVNGDGVHDQHMSTWDAGLLTITYAVTIIGFIRVGEKLLQKYGPRKPMLWGSMVVILSGAFLTPTFVGLGTYKILAIVGYAMFGLGLAFYATPSTDAALSNLPAEKSGSGSGIYKMASSLGGAIGLALSLTIFNALKGGSAESVTYALQMTGVQDNTSLRFAGMVVMLFNIGLTLIAIISITMTVPKGGGSRDLGVTKPVDPTPHASVDEERQAVIARLSRLSLPQLEEIERQVLIRRLDNLDRDALEAIVREHRK